LCFEISRAALWKQDHKYHPYAYVYLSRDKNEITIPLTNFSYNFIKMCDQMCSCIRFKQVSNS
jgi:hypothetical protein